MPRPQALPVMRKTLAARGAHGRARQQGRIGRSDVRLRPSDREKRVDALDRVEQARRRHARVDLAEDPRLLHLLAQVALTGKVKRNRPEHPDDRAPATAPSTRPPSESSHRSGGSTNRLVRIALPAIDAMLWKRITSTAAPPSATSGVYGDSRPERNSGASLAPMYAPTTIPASPSSPPMSPRLSPIRAEIAITPAAIQSMLVTAASRRERRRGRGRIAAGSPPGGRRCSARTP